MTDAPPAAAPTSPPAAPATDPPGGPPATTSPPPATTSPPVAPASPPAAPITPPAASWRDTLPDELRGHHALANHASVTDLAKEHVNLQGLIGRKGTIVPGEGATDDDWNAFYSAVGRPESAEAYQVPQLPDGTQVHDGMSNWFRGAAHKHGLSQRQMEGLYAEYAGWSGQELAAAGKVAADAAAANKASLEREWGGNFTKNMGTADAVIAEGMGEHAKELRELKLADGSFLLDNPHVARLMHAIGTKWFGEGKLPMTPSGELVNTPESAKSEIAKIRSESANDPQHPYTNRRHPEHQAMVTKMRQLHEVAFQGTVQ